MRTQISFVKKRLQTHNGYTIIELVIVIALSAMLLITAVSLFFTTFIGGGKTAAGEYTKQSGEQIMTQMSYFIRNSKRLSPNVVGQTCQSGMSSLALVNQDGGITTFTIANNRIASSSAASTVYMSPTNLTVSGLSFECTNTTPPKVIISFTLQRGAAASRDVVTIPFTSSVTLRNF